MNYILLDKKLNEVVCLGWIKLHVPVWVLKSLLAIGVIYLRMLDEEFSVK